MKFSNNKNNTKGNTMTNFTFKNFGFGMMALILVAALMTGCGGGNEQTNNPPNAQQTAQTLNSAPQQQGQPQGGLGGLMNNNRGAQPQMQGGFQNGQPVNNRLAPSQPQQGQGLGQVMNSNYSNSQPQMGYGQPNRPQSMAQQQPYGTPGMNPYPAPQQQPNYGWNTPQNPYSDPYGFGSYDCGCFENFEDYNLDKFGEDVEGFLDWINPFDDQNDEMNNAWDTPISPYEDVRCRNEQIQGQDIDCAPLMDNGEAQDFYWLNEETGMVIVTQSPQPPAEGFVLLESN